MSSSQSFLKTLKQIGCQEALALDESDLDFMFSTEELSSFMEVFCSLNENNVLTTEEIQEYSAISEAELAEIHAMEKSVIFEKNSDEDKKKRLCFLQEQVSAIENHNKAMEKTRKLFKQHEQKLLKEKETAQKLLSSAKDKFELLQSCILPQAENELKSSLQAILKEISELESLITLSGSNECKIPSSEFFKQAVEEYLSVEEKILLLVTAFLENHFQFQDKEDSCLAFISAEISENEEFLKESNFIQKSLKKQMLSQIATEKEKKKIESMIKNYEEILVSPDLKCHDLQLRSKLQDATELNERLKNKEEELNQFLTEAIVDNVDAQFSELILSLNEKTNSHLQAAIKEILLPMNILKRQRGRLELLLASLHEYKRFKLETLKQLIENVSEHLNQEKLTVQESNIQIEKELKGAVPKHYEHNPETSMYLTLHKILGLPNEYENQDMSHVSLEDVLEQAKRLHEIKNDLSKRHEDNLKVIETMENQASTAEALLNCSDKNLVNWHELDHSLNKDLNNLNIKLAALETRFHEVANEYDVKKKHLEAHRNLQLARKLYIYALKNRELFIKCIEDIKEAVKNSSDF